MKKFILASVMILGLSSIAMAEDWHVKNITENGRRATVIFHIPIPDIDNDASPAVSYRVALGEYIKPQDFTTGTFGTWFSRLQGIDTAPGGELDKLQTGELYEVQAIVKFLELDTDIQKRDKIDAAFATLSSSELSRLQIILKFWGFARNVP